MTDITQRLRDLACGGSNWNNTLTDAADEIERLRALAAPSVPSGEPVAWAPQWAIDRLTGQLGAVADPVTWGVNAPLYVRAVPHCAPIYLAAPAAPGGAE